MITYDSIFPLQWSAKKKAVEKLTNGLTLLMRANKIEVFHGTGILVSSQQVKVMTPGQEIMLQGTNIILATGSTPVALSSVPCDTEYIVHSDHALSFDSIPERLVVVGAGTVGLEIGSIWMRRGSKVTVIELMDQVLPGMDTQICRSLMQILKKQGMEFSLSTEITEYSINGDTVELRGKNNNNEELSFSGNKALIAVGRKPYFEGLRLENLKIELTAKEKIKVNERYQTTDPAVYAIGDIIEGPMLAHKAGEEGRSAAELIAGKTGQVNYETIPCIVYTWPEVASVGITEDQCKSRNIPYTRGIFQFRANGRAITSDNLDGFVKIIGHKETDRILGCSILGPWASDLIPEIVSVMEFGGRTEDINRTMHAHPTLSEAIKEAALDAAGRVIHSMPVAKTH